MDQRSSKLRLIISDRQGKHAFAQECHYLQGIFIYINERNTSSPGCKQNTCGKMELRLTNLVSCTAYYI